VRIRQDEGAGGLYARDGLPPGAALRGAPGQVPGGHDGPHDRRAGPDGQRPARGSLPRP
jgi:hypothetical protein